MKILLCLIANEFRNFFESALVGFVLGHLVFSWFGPAEGLDVVPMVSTWTFNLFE